MSYIPAPNDILKITFVASKLDQASIDSGYFVVTSIPPLANVTLADIAHAMSTACEVAFKAILSSLATFRGVMVSAPFVKPLPQAGTYIGDAGLGAVNGAPLPSQTRGLISTGTDFAGRKYRGRFYCPFPGGDSLASDGSPVAGYVTHLDGFAEDFFIPHTVVGGVGFCSFTPIIVHKKTSTFSYMTRTISRSKWATQRRSGEYGRANASPI